jgi:hypothetical protein
MANPNAVRLTERDLAPPDLSWQRASEAQRRAFYHRAGQLAVYYLRQQLRRGLDKDGNRLAPVKPSSRPDGATGQPLDPHYAESRSWRNLSFSVNAGGVTLWWRGGWGRILGFHGEGAVRGAPVRDIRGLSPASMRKLKADLLLWWRHRHPPQVLRIAQPVNTRGNHTFVGSPNRG